VREEKEKIKISKLLKNNEIDTKPRARPSLPPPLGQLRESHRLLFVLVAKSKYTCAKWLLLGGAAVSSLHLALVGR